MIPDELSDIFMSGWDNPHGENPYPKNTDEWEAFNNGQWGAYWDQQESDDWQSP